MGNGAMIEELGELLKTNHVLFCDAAMLPAMGVSSE
jgi:hypothetical protein